MSNARNIPVKVYLDADSFVSFQNKCREIRMSHSSLLRYLAIQWANDRADDLAVNSTGLAPIWAQPAAGGRVNHGTAPVHLRL